MADRKANASWITGTIENLAIAGEHYHTAQAGDIFHQPLHTGMIPGLDAN